MTKLLILGNILKPKLLLLKSYFENRFSKHYFICKCLGDQQPKAFAFIILKVVTARKSNPIPNENNQNTTTFKLVIKN